MRFKKLGAEDVGESESLRHLDPITGREEINFTDAELSANPPLEDEPDFRDILPDQIQAFGEVDEDAEDAITARPSQPVRPYAPDELPEG
ncbi:hypothetical protein [Cystobacter ferrugineus]|uniref:Uncharacterized protein n=1 Tax=Cystobacter ferrugineus TaxID=83449 RepID=A0A1L9BGJ9_9BACT|nr:hypothetical protein [Cystobacter ferrugineus]OJH41355.1 hypothetical protein BON30_10845 [Cystobacter ferrugineus]